MSREMQYVAIPTAVVNNLYGVWYNSLLQVWNGSAWVEQTDGTATAANCCIAMTQIGSTRSYYANAPAGILTADPSLAQNYTIEYIDATVATLSPTSVVGSQSLGGLSGAQIAASVASPIIVSGSSLTAGYAGTWYPLGKTNNGAPTWTVGYSEMVAWLDGPYTLGAYYWRLTQSVGNTTAGYTANATINTGLSPVLSPVGLSFSPINSNTTGNPVVSALPVPAIDPSGSPAGTLALQNNPPTTTITNSYNVTGIAPIGAVTPIPLQLQQYMAGILAIPVATVVTGKTLSFVVTSALSKTTVLWTIANANITVSSNGLTCTVAVAATNTQTMPPQGWYWYLIDETDHLRIGEGTLTLDPGPNA